MSLADWYAANAGALRANGTDRDRNLVIAAQLLPLFEADPENAWAAVGYLNAAEPAEAQDFAAHLQRWHDVTPQPHRAFVRVVARRFGVTLDDGEQG